jgi:hypothetical protein
VNVINWKDHSTFHWNPCQHEICSTKDIACPYCRIEELEAKLDAKLSCDVCAGTGKVPNGTCICGGSGHMHDEVYGLRQANYDIQAKLDAVLGELTVLVSWIKRGFSATDTATELLAIIEREQAIQQEGE